MSLAKSGWGRKYGLIIDYTLVSATMTNFPVLLLWTGSQATSNLPQEMFDADGSYPAKSLGQDVRFSTDSIGTNELAFEIVNFSIDNNPANARAEIWVKLPSISSTLNTLFYIWYNKPDASAYANTATYGRNNVWTNGYIHVHHFQESSGTLVNSTGNTTYDGSATNITYAQTGRISNCVLFTAASNGYIDLGADSLGAADRSFECWLNATNYTDGGGLGRLISEEIYPDGNNWAVRVTGPSIRLNNQPSNGVSGTIAAAGNWIHLISTRNSTATAVNFYIDGAQSGTVDQNLTSLAVGAQNTRFGAAPGTTTRNYSGLLDEARVLNRIVTLAEATTKFNNQSSPQTFITLGIGSVPVVNYEIGMLFTGIQSQILTTVSTMTPPETGTVCFWMTPVDLTSETTERRILGNDTNYEARITGGYLYADFRGTSINRSVMFAGGILYHVACTFNSGASQIYIDGILDTSGGNPSSAVVDSAFLIGFRPGAPSVEYFDGYIEDVRIYERILSAAEIATIYGCKGSDNIVYGLLHRWIMSSGPIYTAASGTGIIKDIGPVGLHMTPTNSPVYAGNILKMRRSYY